MEICAREKMQERKDGRPGKCHVMVETIPPLCVTGRLVLRGEWHLPCPPSCDDIYQAQSTISHVCVGESLETKAMM